MKKSILTIFLLTTLNSFSAILFNGTDTELANSANTASSTSPLGANTAPNSFSFWFKRYTTNSEEIFWQGATICSNYDFRFNNAASNRLEFHYTYAADGTDHVFSSPPLIGSTLNRWFHVAFAFDPGPFPIPNTVKMWINGTNVTGSWTTGAGNFGRGTCGIFHIGEARSGFAIFKGELDSITFYQGELLKDTEVKTLFSGSVLAPIQIRPKQTLPTATGPVTYLFNEAPEGLGITTVGSVHDLGIKWRASCNPTGTVNFVASKVISYMPME